MSTRISIQERNVQKYCTEKRDMEPGLNTLPLVLFLSLSFSVPLWFMLHVLHLLEHVPCACLKEHLLCSEKWRKNIMWWNAAGLHCFPSETYWATRNYFWHLWCNIFIYWHIVMNACDGDCPILCTRYSWDSQIQCWLTLGDVVPFLNQHNRF